MPGRRVAVIAMPTRVNRWIRRLASSHFLRSVPAATHHRMGEERTGQDASENGTHYVFNSA
jgi:hypothetical protein